MFDGGGEVAMLALAMKLLRRCLKMSKAIILLYRSFKDKKHACLKKKKKIMINQALIIHFYVHFGSYQRLKKIVLTASQCDAPHIISLS